MFTFREYSAARRIHRMFIGSDKNALSQLAKNVQTTRSKFVSDGRRRAERRVFSGEREAEKERKRIITKGKKNSPIELYSAAKRQMEDGRREKTWSLRREAKEGEEMEWIVVDR